MKLFEQLNVGDLTLKNKIVMSPMTRSRADMNGVVGDMTILYYTQRINAGLIISEAINISDRAIGSPLTPGIYKPEQIEAWKKVTQAVHEKGGLIFAQLWHAGRVGHSVDRKGVLPEAPSAIGIKTGQHFTLQGMKDYETPRELTKEDIKSIIEDYVQAAENAMEAGFDGVEFHSANGYLAHQFLSESSNLRTDEYGGSIENNCRFTLEITKRLIEAIGKNKVSIKISPFQPYGDILTEDPIKTYTYLIQELNKLNLAFVHLMKRSYYLPLPESYPKEDEVDLFGKLITHPILANGGYNRDSGEAELERGVVDFIAYGTLFLANPDLPKRFKLNAELNEPDVETMFSGGEKGYTDYPSLQ